MSSSVVALQAAGTPGIAAAANAPLVCFWSDRAISDEVLEQEQDRVAVAVPSFGDVLVLVQLELVSPPARQTCELVIN